MKIENKSKFVHFFIVIILRYKIDKLLTLYKGLQIYKLRYRGFFHSERLLPIVLRYLSNPKTNNTMVKYVSKALLMLAIGHLFLFIGCNETSTINVPYISSFTPLKGRVDTVVTIIGRNFSRTASGNMVNINGYRCPIISVSDTEIVIKAVPGISSGIVSVTVQNLSAVAINSFELNEQVIESFEPDTAMVGEQINFTGRFFSDKVDSVHVRFNNVEVPIANYTVVDEVATFSAVVPANAYTGKVTVRIAAIEVETEKDLVIKE
jgi:hypothetical protein